MKKKEMRRKLQYALDNLKSLDATRLTGVDTICLGHAEADIAIVIQALMPDSWVGVPNSNGDIMCYQLAPLRCIYVHGHYGGHSTP